MLRFGPSRSFTYASTWPWLGHLVSGLIRSTYRPIQARFHYGSARWLNLALQINSLDRSTKSTPSQNKSAPTPCRHAISGSISLPSRGSFHLSLTVLVHYRSRNVFSLGRWSFQIQTGFHVSRPTRENTYKVSLVFAYRAITVFGAAFQLLLLTKQISYLMRDMTDLSRIPERSTNQVLWHGLV